MDLERATWPEAADLDTDLAVLPVGSTEQHGPHAPLGTDTLAATAVAEAGVEAFDGEVAVAPALPVGIAEEHRHFAGTLWLEPDTFRDAVRDCVRSLAHHGFDRVVVVNGHGGNVDALREVTAELSRHDDVYAVAFTWFEAVGDHSAEMGHAGPLETSLLRAIEPDLVREDRVASARDGAADGWGEWVSHTNVAHDSAEFTENGVVGDPTDGDADRGEELRELAAESLARLLTAVDTREFDASSPTH
ncbi:creatininase [Halovivax asiaticus JCM 14624]|uniref:Creatininase n=1 Tax=Halovivax asiaticus JCM 14624 TaxID=1227490 RepID=M0BGL4_9EURY|nr:creatininase family protein [Halovivax asiaticus]ELZ09443.1 creatininase [Halovivax asiaticus JCM 14624]